MSSSNNILQQIASELSKTLTTSLVNTTKQDVKDSTQNTKSLDIIDKNFGKATAAIVSLNKTFQQETTKNKYHNLENDLEKGQQSTEGSLNRLEKSIDALLKVLEGSLANFGGSGNTNEGGGGGLPPMVPPKLGGREGGGGSTPRTGPTVESGGPKGEPPAGGRVEPRLNPPKSPFYDPPKPGKAPLAPRRTKGVPDIEGIRPSRTVEPVIEKPTLKGPNLGDIKPGIKPTIEPVETPKVGAGGVFREAMRGWAYTDPVTGIPQAIGDLSAATGSRAGAAVSRIAGGPVVGAIAALVAQINPAGETLAQEMDQSVQDFYNNKNTYTANKVQRVLLRAKSELTPSQYTEFIRKLSGTQLIQEPLLNPVIHKEANDINSNIAAIPKTITSARGGQVINPSYGKTKLIDVPALVDRSRQEGEIPGFISPEHQKLDREEYDRRTKLKQLSSSSPNAGKGTFVGVGHYKSAGAENVDPRLRDILETAAKLSGRRVEAFSGYRPGDPRFHGRGKATDIKLFDENGKEIPNYQNSKGFREYEKFVQIARRVQQEKYPELSKNFRWGGYFGGGRGLYGAVDTMHFDLGGSKNLGMAGGSWAHGLTPIQRKIWRGANSVGMDDQVVNDPNTIQTKSTNPETIINKTNVSLTAPETQTRLKKLVPEQTSELISNSPVDSNSTEKPINIDASSKKKAKQPQNDQKNQLVYYNDLLHHIEHRFNVKHHYSDTAVA